MSGSTFPKTTDSLTRTSTIPALSRRQKNGLMVSSTAVLMISAPTKTLLCRRKISCTTASSPLFSTPDCLRLGLFWIKFLRKMFRSIPLKVLSGRSSDGANLFGASIKKKAPLKGQTISGASLEKFPRCSIPERRELFL